MPPSNRRNAKPLAALLAEIGQSGGNLGNAEIRGVQHDSRQVQPGDLFVAVPGFRQHGADFAGSAIAAGAVAVLTDHTGATRLAGVSVPVVAVPDPRETMGRLAAAFYDRPAERMLSVGITGTNGKTTTAHMVAAELEATGMNPLLLGTVGVRFRGKHWPSARTTPEATDLQLLLSDALQAGAKGFVMEVSSHALVLGRVAGMQFDVAVFTGLSQDHLDFHGTMEDYFAAKARLFTPEFARNAVINVDTEWGARLARECEIPHRTYSIEGAADWQAVDLAFVDAGRMRYRVVGPTECDLRVELAMPGRFNLANSLAAIAAAHELGLDLELATAGLADVVVPGRLERVDCGQDFVALVDYAHTPDAVERALEVARACAAGRVIAVLGCGGDRDAAKRTPMGEVAAAGAQLVIVTDDNPRSEDPAVIRAALLAGANGGPASVIEVPNRMTAIHRACREARPGDCVIVLGKGHETGQEVHGVITPFDDREVLAEAVRAVMS